MIKKEDWKTENMPEETETFILDRNLEVKDIEYLKEGFRPTEMEDKWFVYTEENKVYAHRSWTGYCIYIIDITNPNSLKVTVNRNPKEYQETDLEREKEHLNQLLDFLTRKC